MKFRRETAKDDYRRTHELAAALGASLEPHGTPVSPLRKEFEETVAHALHANVSTEPPAGHTYPKRG
ncbi:hypothetical protein HZZ00_37245 (plasmid) [Streptomyces sp. NEAU-sy36]|uniref:hypothetical protein n=1 Tax=unclassified Streptomyces TaxID=2593676 RepID=UPI0015D5829F|nr:MULTISPECIES: hypothetical protein [unclassified Streptomyces]QLJ06680.1 hypothetical protein HZZ00_37245 [Streptomyces sp. NEAU-sy36]